MITELKSGNPGFAPITISITLETLTEVTEFARMLDLATDRYDEGPEDGGDDNAINAVAWKLYRRYASINSGQLITILRERGIPFDEDRFLA